MRYHAASAAPIRVVIADDSAFMRRLLYDAIVAQGAQVVGQAADGDQALRECERTRPDVLSLDLTMPGMDGIGVLRALRERGSPVAVVVVSAFSPAHGAHAVDALAEGAMELVAKPSAGTPPEKFFAELGAKLQLAAGAASIRRTTARSRAAAPPAAVAPRPIAPHAGGTRRTVVVACSTGGPKALAELIPQLPAEVGDGVLIVQHMPAGFTASLAQRLDRNSRLAVREAAGGERPQRGTVLLAPGGKHMRLRDGVVRLTEEAEVGGLRPRADLTIADAAATYGSKLLLVVLTGMGRDGLEGAKAVRRAGGRVLAEAESTCTVYGMPRAVVEAALADDVLPLGQLAGAITRDAA
jgi:two-component system chemotaxis response regulator CheB